MCASYGGSWYLCRQNVSKLKLFCGQSISIELTATADPSDAEVISGADISLA